MSWRAAWAAAAASSALVFPSFVSCSSACALARAFFRASSSCSSSAARSFRSAYLSSSVFTSGRALTARAVSPSGVVTRKSRSSGSTRSPATLAASPKMSWRAAWAASRASSVFALSSSFPERALRRPSSSRSSSSTLCCRAADLSSSPLTIGRARTAREVRPSGLEDGWRSRPTGSTRSPAALAASLKMSWRAAWAASRAASTAVLPSRVSWCPACSAASSSAALASREPRSSKLCCRAADLLSSALTSGSAREARAERRPSGPVARMSLSWWSTRSPAARAASPKISWRAAWAAAARASALALPSSACWCSACLSDSALRSSSIAAACSPLSFVSVARRASSSFTRGRALAARAVSPSGEVTRRSLPWGSAFSPED